MRFNVYPQERFISIFPPLGKNQSPQSLCNEAYGIYNLSEDYIITCQFYSITFIYLLLQWQSTQALYRFTNLI